MLAKSFVAFFPLLFWGIKAYGKLNVDDFHYSLECPPSTILWFLFYYFSCVFVFFTYISKSPWPDLGKWYFCQGWYLTLPPTYPRIPQHISFPISNALPFNNSVRQSAVSVLMHKGSSLGPRQLISFFLNLKLWRPFIQQPLTANSSSARGGTS